MATSSGELGAILYFTSQLNDNNSHIKEAKDNGLMTALMSSVENNNIAGFIHLFFEERCNLNTVDLNGNTILHIAAKANAINIAKILKHLYTDLKTNRNSKFIKKQVPQKQSFEEGKISIQSDDED